MARSTTTIVDIIMIEGTRVVVTSGTTLRLVQPAQKEDPQQPEGEGETDDSSSWLPCRELGLL
jgi:hypothetical protein